MKNKRIVVTCNSIDELHGLWKNFMKNPPLGYEYIFLNELNEKEKIEINKNGNNQTIEVKKSFLYNFKNKIISLLIKNIINYGEKISFITYFLKRKSNLRITKKVDKLNPDIVYCINGIIYYGKKPWIVDFENPTIFSFYNYKSLLKNKQKIINSLKVENCKGIISYSNSGLNAFNSFFEDEDLLNKSIRIYNCIKTKEFNLIKKEIIKQEEKDFVILFIGSSNIGDNFYGRGGKLLINTFLNLSKKYNDIKLILRCSIPEDYKKRLKNKNVEIYDDVLSEDKFEELFYRSDVFFFPAFNGYALSILEAMNYGLTILTSDLLENGEYIENEINGYKIKLSNINFLSKEIPDYYSNNQTQRWYKLYSKDVKLFEEKIEYLYNNRKILKDISENNIQKVKDYFTVEKKNIQLKKLYDEILQSNK